MAGLAVGAAAPAGALAQPWGAHVHGWPAASAAPPNLRPDRIARIDALFRRWDEAGSPGAALAIVGGGRVVHARGFGLADLEHRVPITPRTRFHVASVSKQFTAFAIAHLAEEGRLSLADDVRRHLPEVPYFGHTITLSNLLHHTSGLRDQWTLLALAGWRLDDVITQRDVLELVARQRELNFPPGSEYLYSNTGYTLLAEVVARVGGATFPAWMRDRVFAPLGLRDTHVHDDHRMIVPGRAESYGRGRDGGWIRQPLNYATAGATNLFTTARDLARWASHVMRPRLYRRTFERLVQPGRLADGRSIDYALGIQVAVEGGRVRWEHSGGDAGFRSHLLMFPDEKLGVVVLANEASLDAGALAHEVAGIVLEGDPPPLAPGAGPPRDTPEEGASFAAPVESEVPLDRRTAEDISGTYWNPVADYVRRIRVERGRVLYDRGDGNVSPLRPIGGRTFRMLGLDASLYVRFEPERGAARRMLVRIGDDPEIEARRIADAASPDPASLAAYVGSYGSPELGTMVRIAAREEGLVLLHPRHGAVPLEPIAEDRFASREWWLGQIRFERSATGDVTGFRSTSGRVRHLLFQRGLAGMPARFAVPPP